VHDRVCAMHAVGVLMEAISIVHQERLPVHCLCTRVLALRSALRAAGMFVEDVPMYIQVIAHALLTQHCPAHQQPPPLMVVLPWLAVGVTAPRYTTRLIGVLLCGLRAQQASNSRQLVLCLEPRTCIAYDQDHHAHAVHSSAISAMTAMMRPLDLLIPSCDACSMT